VLVTPPRSPDPSYGPQDAHGQRHLQARPPQQDHQEGARVHTRERLDSIVSRPSTKAGVSPPGSGFNARPGEAWALWWSSITAFWIYRRR
jgi:hypothetical protein